MPTKLRRQKTEVNHQAEIQIFNQPLDHDSEDELGDLKKQLLELKNLRYFRERNQQKKKSMQWNH